VAHLTVSMAPQFYDFYLWHLRNTASRAIAQGVSGRFPTAAYPGSIPGYVGFMGDKVAMEQGSSEYFGVPSQFSSHQLLQSPHHHHHPGLVQWA
jgi:hypothetical protein